MPRSDSRDRSDPFTGNRGYFHRPDTIRQWKYVLAGVAAVAALGWAAADVAQPGRVAIAYAHTHGPLAGPHAAFDNDCAACHVPQSLNDFGVVSVFQARDRWHDFTCEKCHAGPAHHDTVTPAGKDFHARCSNCHHDHGGRTTSLVRITDSHCTKCHADLAKNHAAGATAFGAKVTDFVTDHPEFRPLKAAPNRTLKFSHALHMTPGQMYVPGEKRENGGKDLVQLDCASCHRPDASGARFQPVNFESDCRSCHPLTAPAGEADGRLIPEFPLPHGKQPAALRDEIAAGYLRGLVKPDNPKLTPPKEPGGLLDQRPEKVAGTVRTEIDRLTKTAGQVLFDPKAGCAKCHDVTANEVAKVPDRSVWFPSVRFDHTKHRGVGCANCHPGTAAAFAPGGSVVEKENVQILGVESCRQCHAPAGTRVERDGGASFLGGGVRHGCADCHRYHNGDHAPPGWVPKNTVPEFLGAKR